MYLIIDYGIDNTETLLKWLSQHGNIQILEASQENGIWSEFKYLKHKQYESRDMDAQHRKKWTCSEILCIRKAHILRNGRIYIFARNNYSDRHIIDIS